MYQRCHHTVFLVICFLLVTNTCFSQVRFVDFTEASGILPHASAIDIGSGIAAVDYDNDGDIDIYTTTKEDTPNGFYRNLGNGSFEEIASAVGLASNLRGRAALWFDYDGDHKLDLFVAGDCLHESSICEDGTEIKLYHQISSEEFEDVTALSGLPINLIVESVQTFGGVTAGDINNDNYLDLFFGYWRGKAWLFLNNGDGTFTDISITSTIQDDGHNYWQPLMYDFDGNGTLDLYLNVDVGPNQLWLNHGNNTFSEVAAITGVDNAKTDMGIAFGDYDNDMDMDMYITNINFSIFYQNNSTPNQLEFSQISSELEVDDAGWGWGASFLDLNNDGFLDLVATNGSADADLDQSRLWINNGDGTFVNATDQTGFDDFFHASTVIGADFDRDGDLDLAQDLKDNLGQYSSLRLLENELNETAEFGNYLVIRPRMSGNNHYAIGADVIVKAGTLTMKRPILTGMSFYGQEPAEAFFGLGDETLVEEVSVKWPGGAISIVENVAVNQVLTIHDSDQLVYPPINFNAINVSANTVTLNWIHNDENKVSFMIHRSSTNTFNSIVANVISADLTEFIDTGLELDSTYFYRIKTIGNLSNSEFSPTIQVTTLDQVTLPTIINPPTELAIEQVSETNVRLNWNDNSDNEIGFIIERSLSEDFEEVLRYFDHVNSTSFEDNGLDPFVPYYYRVMAYGTNSASGFSNTVVIVPIVSQIGEDHKNLDKIKVFPNPTAGSFTFQLDNTFTDEFHVNLIDASGKVLDSYRFIKSERSFEKNIELNVSPGIYFLDIYGKELKLPMQRLLIY